MHRVGGLALITILALSAGAASAQTKWPDLSKRDPGISQSPVAAVVWSANIEPPGPDVPADKARWSGKWSGWACVNQSCDARLIVEKVTADGAAIIYAVASAKKKPNTARLSAKFVGEELQATFRNGAKVSYRMRPEGDLEVFWRTPNVCRELSACLPEWYGGVLSKDK